MFAKNNLFLVICLTLMISCANEKNMQIGDIIDAAINNITGSNVTEDSEEEKTLLRHKLGTKQNYL